MSSHATTNRWCTYMDNVEPNLSVSIDLIIESGSMKQMMTKSWSWTRRRLSSLQDETLGCEMKRGFASQRIGTRMSAEIWM